MFDRRLFLNRAALCGLLSFAGVEAHAKENSECPPIDYPPVPADLTHFAKNGIADMTQEDAKIIVREASMAQQTFAAEAIIFTLKTLAKIHHGFPIHQLDHVLQTATRAYRANAGDAWILAALCHDMMKTISNLNHDAMAAEVLKPYVPANVYFTLRNHQLFEGRFYYKNLHVKDDEYKAFAMQPWYADALRFSAEWDAPSFEQKYKSKPLAEFAPLIHKMVLAPLERV